MRPWMFWALSFFFYAVSAYALRRMKVANELLDRTYGPQHQRAVTDARFWIVVGVVCVSVGIMAFLTSVVLMGFGGLRKRARRSGLPMD